MTDRKAPARKLAGSHSWEEWQAVDSALADVREKRVLVVEHRWLSLTVLVINASWLSVS